MDLHITRLTAELAGLIRKYKGRFILSRDCRAVLNGQGLAALYPRLFKAYVEPVSDKRFCREYRVKRLPLLRDAVHFRLSP